jgi:hypothetical protein
MADSKTTIAIEVEVEGIEPSIESIKDLKNAIKAAKDEQVKMANAFGDGSKEYLDATKKLSGLKDKVDDLNDSTKSLKGTGVEQLTQGFAQMKEGIMNLDFDKVKTGFAAMKSGIAAFASSAKTALQGVKGALLATGIGALVVALGVIVAYWDDIKGAIDGVTSEQKKLNAVAKENLTVEQDKLKSLEASDNLLKLQGKSEREILELKIKQLDLAYEKAEVDLLNTIQTQLFQVEAEKRNKAILAGSIESTLKPIQLLMSALDLAGKALGKNFGLAESIKKMTMDSVSGDDAEKDAARKKELDASIQLLKDLKSKRAGYQIAINKIDDDAEKTKIENQKEITAANLAAIKAIEDAKIAAIKDDELRAFAQEVLNNERRLKDIAAGKESETLKRQEREAQAILFEANLTKINADGAAKRKAEEDRIAAEKKAADEKAAADKKAADEKAAEEKKAADKKAADEKLAAEIELRNAIFEATKQGLDSIQAVTDIAFKNKLSNVKKGSKEEEAILKKQFELNKAFQIAGAIMNGIQGVLAITTVPDFTLGIATALRIGTQIALAATSVAKIAATKFEGGNASASGGGGGAAPMPSIPSPPTIATSNNNTNQTTSFDENGKNLDFKQPQINVTATVGVDEIAKKSNRVEVLEQQSTF